MLDEECVPTGTFESHKPTTKQHTTTTQHREWKSNNTVQGNLTHKKQYPPNTLQRASRAGFRLRAPAAGKTEKNKRTLGEIRVE